MTSYTSGAKTTFEYPGKVNSRIPVQVQPAPKAGPRAAEPEEVPRQPQQTGGGATPGWEGIFDQAFAGFVDGAAQPKAQLQTDRLWNAVEGLIKVHVSSDDRASRMRRAMGILFHADSGAESGEILARANALIDTLAPKSLVD